MALVIYSDIVNAYSQELVVTKDLTWTIFSLVGINLLLLHVANEVFFRRILSQWEEFISSDLRQIIGPVAKRARLCLCNRLVCFRIVSYSELLSLLKSSGWILGKGEAQDLVIEMFLYEYERI